MNVCMKSLLIPSWDKSLWRFTYYPFLLSHRNSTVNVLVPAEKVCNHFVSIWLTIKNFFFLTSYPWSGFIRSRVRRWVRSSSRWRRMHIWWTQLCLCEPLHYSTVLGVAVLAAALFPPTVLCHNEVVAAVVAEDATAKPNIKINTVIFYYTVNLAEASLKKNAHTHWRLTCNDVCAATRWTDPGSQGSAWPLCPPTTIAPLLAVSAQTPERLTSATEHPCPWSRRQRQ